MFQPNAVIAGRYQVVRLVGQGGMSNLYLAYDRKYSNATVVVKEMTASYSDPKEQKMAVDLFHREAKLLASLNHRHIPKVFDYFQFAGKYYLSMEYIDGEDLAVRLEDTKGPLPEEQVLKWGEQIAQVLFYLHKHDPPIVFRDVKPSNIMISSKGVKLIDFGIARHFDQAKKGDTMRIGSPGYAPPEQYAAQTDPRSDIYALGVTLHHALTGRDPTATNTPFLVPPARDINPAVSEGAAAMLARATQLDPADRYQSALEMRKDIKHILGRGKQSTRVVGAPPALPNQADKKTEDKKAKGKTTATGNAGTAQAAPATAAQPAATATAAAAPSAATANTAVGSQTGNSPSGSLPNQSNATGSGSLTPPASNQQASPAGKKKKKRPSFAALLLVAAVFVISAGVAALFSMQKSDRDALIARAQQFFQGAVSDLYQPDSPESRLRNYLLNGSPEALLTVFQSPDFQELSEEKKELYRLNLLAVGSEQGPVRFLHVVTPDSYDGAPLWKVATQVVGTVNSTGGLGKELLVVIPHSYKPGQLSNTLNRLTKNKGDDVNQAFLVVDGSQETAPADFESQLHRLSAAEIADSKFISAEPNYESVFSLKQILSSNPTIWGVPGSVPTSATPPSTDIESPLDASKLENLISEAENVGGDLLLRAEDSNELSNVSTKGSVLLLATSAQQLPPLGANLKGRALVLSSPFETIEPPTAIHLRPSDTKLSLQEARSFDALLIAALPNDKPYQGMTMIRQSDGTFSDKNTTEYSWTGKTWLPSLKETGKKE